MVVVVAVCNCGGSSVDCGGDFVKFLVVTVPGCGGSCVSFAVVAGCTCSGSHKKYWCLNEVNEFIYSGYNKW